LAIDFENAMYFNDDSHIFKDAKFLQKMYNTNKKELFKIMGFKTTSVLPIKVKPKIFQFQPDSPKLTPTDPRKPILKLDHDSVEYTIGDFVYLLDPSNSLKRNIIVIERLFVNSKLQKRFAGSFFFRPDQCSKHQSLKNICYVYDAAKKAAPLLQGIGVGASDRSFAMSLNTKHFAHSITLGPTANHVTVIPILASNLLLPAPKPVVLDVYREGRKVTNRARMTFPNSPTIAHSTFTIPLTPGVNNIDIWVSVPIMTTEYGGGVNGIFMVNGAVSPAEDTQAERYYIFIKK
ncbi:hypothetical protein G9A89_000191, partial [Geosiphon pyriformis]